LKEYPLGGHLSGGIRIMKLLQHLKKFGVVGTAFNPERSLTWRWKHLLITEYLRHFPLESKTRKPRARQYDRVVLTAFRSKFLEPGIDVPPNNSDLDIRTHAKDLR
jgi:hypothetical protein